MKRIAAVLLLTFAVILSAGCVAEQDPIIGTWESVEPLEDSVSGLSYTNIDTFNADGTATMQVIYPDGDISVVPFSWVNNGDGTYSATDMVYFTLSEDGKTLTRYSGYVFTGADSLTEGVWKLEMAEDLGFSVESVFNADGTGTETAIFSDGTKSVFPFSWKRIGENSIGVTFLYEFTFAGDTMTDAWGYTCVFDENSGLWVDSPIEGESYLKYQFNEDGTGLEFVYLTDTGEEYDRLQFIWEQTGENTKTIQYTNVVLFTLNEDGTLTDSSDGMVLAKTTA